MGQWMLVLSSSKIWPTPPRHQASKPDFRKSHNSHRPHPRDFLMEPKYRDPNRTLANFRCGSRAALGLDLLYCSPIRQAEEKHIHDCGPQPDCQPKDVRRPKRAQSRAPRPHQQTQGKEPGERGRPLVPRLLLLWSAMPTCQRLQGAVKHYPHREDQDQDDDC
jgi:hypothetical protein